jgi:hypothetical protein
MSAHASKAIRFVPKMPPLLGHAPSARHGGVVESRDREIERLHLIIRKLQPAQFERRSERLDPDQMAFALGLRWARAIASKRGPPLRTVWKLSASRRSGGCARARCIR